ncbi:MAG TPA: hypothetical protein VFN10_16455 [Thermoanaerobaculia bacterium]|nr:hypothetical protein [Thermoanaerobaculia bacterium]
MTDFDGIEGQLDAWSHAMSGWVDEVIASVNEQLPAGGECQFYNLVTNPQPGPLLEQEVIWSGFPRMLLNLYGREKAFALADEKLYPLTEANDPSRPPFYTGAIWKTLFYRPLDEYCEWRVEKNDEGKITKVTFTSEPPEYWQALHGDTLADFNGVPKYPTVGDPQRVLDLYRELVNPAVTLDDLRCPIDFVDDTSGQTIYAKGAYNPYNKWNSTHGIMHLGQPNNSLSAEVGLGGLATVIFHSASRDPIVLGEALICAGRLGGPNRTSDPTIASTVNDLARLGAAITLRNPVGLYMDGINLTGLVDPGGKPIPAEFFKVVRGDAKQRLIERAVFEVPKSEGYVVGDITIAGERIRFGGQLAERVKVKLVGVGSALGSFSNASVPAIGQCCVSTDQPMFLRRPSAIDEPCVATQYRAFAWGGNPQGAMPMPPPQRRLVEAALFSAAPARPRMARHRTR